ncbi:MAG: undecaprenyl/decaprenyl-phosphate alpha-N-acetylglucosaminyl 1-phosphate transferase [Synergistaceae bacterium]|nr:undecaprenyl/decaprenyl-phosphate alpha-N-acetylglucosaminyl 1-phosphate transferase [Synergistaceae bacterium]MBR0257414.1 undecaprenyl/decaprenyl-phosphate alpha-N-acetylglucosaminyl 1-phosphate transferase [Synergistaceae bacterium]
MLDVRLFMFMLAGFFWGGLTAPISIKLAGIYGIIDVPDARKIHTGNMPRGAGIGLWLGYMLMAVLMSDSSPSMRFIATGATVIFLCGYLDDMCSLSPYLRLALHIMASALVVVPLNLGFMASVIAVLWVAGVTSAYNLIDGMNGLCISIFIASSVALFMTGHSYAGIYMGAMALGVLCWNFPSAQTFLGDGGSTLLGYLFAAHFLTVSGDNLSQMPLPLMLGVLALFGGVPVIDTLTAFTRRILCGKSPFYPDKKHLHHILISLTGSNVITVTIILSLQLFMLAWGMRLWPR